MHTLDCKAIAAGILTRPPPGSANFSSGGVQFIVRFWLQGNDDLEGVRRVGHSHQPNLDLLIVCEEGKVWLMAIFGPDGPLDPSNTPSNGNMLRADIPNVCEAWDLDIDCCAIHSNHWRCQ